MTTRKKEKTVYVERMKRFVGALQIAVGEEEKTMDESVEEDLLFIVCVKERMMGDLWCSVISVGSGITVTTWG